MPQFIDLTNQKFGRLIVLEKAHNDKWGNLQWLCRCECGSEKIILGSSLRSGDTKSCGCLKRKHGQTKTKTYKIWHYMIQRCTNPKNKSYKDYGGRGITVCKRWRNFVNFLKDMGIPKSGLTLDRTDNNKGYCKSNCRWATRKQQNRNSRHNHLETYNGKTQCLSVWAEEYEINHNTLYARLRRGWSIKRALTTQVDKRTKGEKNEV